MSNKNKGNFSQSIPATDIQTEIFLSIIPKLSKIMNPEQLDKTTKILSEALSNYSIQPKAVDTSSNNAVLLQNFLTTKRLSGAAETTLSLYKYYLSDMLRYIDTPIKDITTNQIKKYLYDYQVIHKISNSSLEHRRVIIKTFFDWLVLEEYIYKNPVLKIASIKGETKPRTPLTQQELETIRNACNTKRERCIIELLYCTGCRVSELANLTKEDIDFTTKEVHLFGKGSKYRVSYLSARAEALLRLYFKERQQESNNCSAIISSETKPYHHLQRQGIEKIVREIAERVPEVTKKVTPHVFRHTMATIALSNGMDLVSIQSLLGHSKIETTLIYSKINSDKVKAQFNSCII